MTKHARFHSRSLLCLGILPALAFAACGDGSGGLDATVLPDAGGPADAQPPFDAGEVIDTGPLPTVSRLNPARGPASGGTRVVLRGTAFKEPAQVFFGDAEASSVVVLDEVSIAVTTPPGAIGSVTVRVVTEAGEGELVDAFRYVRELRLDSIEPARIPEEGGVQVTLRGVGFDEDTIVLLDRKPLRGTTLVSDTELVGYAPALLPGRPEVRLVQSEANANRSDVLVVFATPELESLAPGYGPIQTASGQEASGDGLTGTVEVQVGSVQATELEVMTDDRAQFKAPELAEGVHDVVVDNGDAQAVLTGGFVAYDPSAPGRALLGVTPSRVSSAGGDIIALVGRGFGNDAQAVLAGQRLTVESISANAVRVLIPANLPLGAQDVSVITGGETLMLAGAVTVYAPVEVTSIDPASGPAVGGTDVTIIGSGFVAGAEVRIADVPLSDVVVLSDTEIQAKTVAGTHGQHDVVVKTIDDQGVLQDGFRYIEAFEVIAVEPSDGSISGNTYVSIIGRGFEAPASAQFDGQDGLEPQLENGSVLAVRTPPHNSGTVDVGVTASGSEVLLSGAFTYYDPRLITGGAWGGEIEGAVNVSVMTFQGNPIPGMVVQLGFNADLRYTAITDENGIATISSPEIRGAQTITAGAPLVEYVTYMELNARNLTIVASPHPQSAPPDAPLSPCPTPQAAPTVSGRVFKIKTSRDPVTQPGFISAARITYTQANTFSPNPVEPPEQQIFLFENGAPGQALAEGAPFTITVMRVGTVAVYGELGELDTNSGQFFPRRMGIARSVPVAPETDTPGVILSFDIELSGRTALRLDNPPDQVGQGINAIFPFLNLGSDGVIPFPATAVQGSNTVILQNLPAVSESDFIYMGGSFTVTPAGTLGNPYSLSLVESAEPLENGIDLGPFLEMPHNVSPKAGQLLVDGAISWDQGGIIPDVAVINVVDVTTVSGCCCVDVNTNGQCDTGEPEQCGGLPQQFNRWSIYGPGGLQSYVMPEMPASLEAFEPPRTYGWLLQTAIAPRFSYREFVFNQFSPFFWQSWMVWQSNLLVKEQTD